MQPKLVGVTLLLIALTASLLPLPASGGPLDEVSCYGVKEIGLESPVVPLVGVGPMTNQGVVVDMQDLGDVGVFILKDDDNDASATPGVFDYIMSGWTYRETKYCEEIVCPVVDNLEESLGPHDPNPQTALMQFELARSAGCLDDVSPSLHAEEKT